jgi:2-iminobutanoate/2-iminopropanoate deaminase
MTDNPSPTPPRPLGPYTPVVRAGDWVICSGQVGLRDGRLVDGLEEQVAQAIANIATLLAGQGAGLDSVAKTTVFLADIADFAAMNDAYMTAFGPHRPARSAFAVAALPVGARVEIEAWAFLGEKR